MLPVRQNLPRTLRVFAGGVTPALKLRARRQQLKCSEIPVEYRHALNLLRGEYGGDVGLFSLELRYLAGDFHRLCHRADLQLRIGANRTVDVNAGAGNFVRLESRCLNVNLVIVRNKVGDAIATILVGCRFLNGSLGHVGDHDLSPGNPRPLSVRNGSGDSAVYRLRLRAWRR